MVQRFWKDSFWRNVAGSGSLREEISEQGVVLTTKAHAIWMHATIKCSKIRLIFIVGLRIS